MPPACLFPTSFFGWCTWLKQALAVVLSLATAPCRMPLAAGAVLEGSDVVFQTKIMNEHLICSLCMGYLRDAMTVTGALHLAELLSLNPKSHSKT